MNVKKHVLRSLPFCLILALGFLGFRALVKLRRPPATTEHSRSTPLVETIPIKQGANSLRLEADGEVVPFKQVTLAAQVQGPIVLKSDACRAGRFVRKGELLMQIDPRDYDLDIRRTQELIEQTQVNIEELDVEVRNTKELIALAEEDARLQAKEVARFEELRRQGASSVSTLDSAKRRQIQASNAVQTQRNQARVLTTRRTRLISEKDRLAIQLEQAKLNRQRCDIVAPMEGVVVSDPVEQDDFVQPGRTLLQMEDTERLEVRFDLKLDQLRWIWASVGADNENALQPNGSYDLPTYPVSIQMESSYGEYRWTGELSRYDDAGLDPATRTVACIATVHNPRGAQWHGERDVVRAGGVAPPTLLRGMFVRVTFDVPCSQPLLTIPVVALRPGNRVWIERSGKLVVEDVTVAQSSGDTVSLLPSPQVQPGDALVVSPLSIGISGMEVRIDPTIAVAEVSSESDLTPSNERSHEKVD